MRALSAVQVNPTDAVDGFLGTFPGDSEGGIKKPTCLNTQPVVRHVGLLVNGPPGPAGLPFT